MLFQHIQPQRFPLQNFRLQHKPVPEANVLLNQFTVLLRKQFTIQEMAIKLLRIQLSFLQLLQHTLLRSQMIQPQHILIPSRLIQSQRIPLIHIQCQRKLILRYYLLLTQSTIHFLPRLTIHHLFTNLIRFQLSLLQLLQHTLLPCQIIQPQHILILLRCIKPLHIPRHHIQFQLKITRRCLVRTTHPLLSLQPTNPL